jgi:hypothetical protein
MSGACINSSPLASGPTFIPDHSPTGRRMNIEPETRDNIRQSYEFALNRVGHDKGSGAIWSDYIQFLKSGEVTRQLTIETRAG